MLSSAALLDEFKKDLANLKDNDKYKINALTYFARDYLDQSGIPEGVVAATTSNVRSVSSGLKLIALYVIDSIVKNVGGVYRMLFSDGIVDLFVHSFESIRDEKGRIKLYNLRATWRDVFPNSRMYELDVRVREHDPAWPLLAKPDDVRSSIRSLPNVPKISKAKAEDSSSDQPGESQEHRNSDKSDTHTNSRDPRLNRNIKHSPITEEKCSPLDEFMIDRSGDKTMESKARKQGKKSMQPREDASQPLFGVRDKDMRPQDSPSLPAISPARSGIWSSYFGKHSEVISRRASQDIDMRFSCSNQKPQSSPTEGSNLSPTLPHSPRDPRIPLKSAIAPVPQNAHAPRTSYCDSLPLASHYRQSAPVPRQSRSPISQEPEFHRSHLPVYPSLPPLPPFPRDHHPRRSPSSLPRVPPISGPTWNVEIEGFPDMINIGVDPRMLSLVTHPRPPRRITIDGYQYPLLLDRVQPVIKVGDQFHAIRFRCEKLHAMIDDRTFAINGTGYSRIYVGSRTHLACLGGPGHELVINGKPHTVPFGSHVTFINISYNSIGVRFVGETPQNVDVLPAIPPRLLKWAAEGYFGSPAHLYKPPFNPLKEMHRIADQRTQQLETNGECGSSPSEPVVQSHQQMQSNQAHIRMQLNNNELGSDNSQLFPLQDAPQTQKIDIHSLFQKLVEAGIVSRPEAKAEPPKEPPLLTEYSWEKFRLPFVLEVDSLYGGEQCVHCGLRFVNEHSKEYASHLDYHYVKKSTEAENQGRSRNFYQPYRYWLMSEITRDGGPQLENCSPIDNIPECKCKAFTEPSLNLCSVCFEKFEEFWDHEEEEWMLRNAVMIDGKAYHPICQEDAGKQFAATSPNQEQARTEDQATVQATSLESHSNEDESSNAVLSPPAEQTSSSSNKDSAQKRPLEPATEEVLDPKRICTPTRVVTLKLEDVISTVHTSSDTDVESTHWKVKSEPIEKAALDSSCLNHSDCNAIDPIPPHPESPEQTLSSTTGILEPLVIQPDLATISYETIKADPLAALKAVLSRGAMAASTSSKG